MRRQDEPIDHPGAWRVSEFVKRLSRATFDFSRHTEVLADAVKQVQAQGLATLAIEREDFAKPTLSAELAAIRDEVLHGHGIVLLRALPR